MRSGGRRPPVFRSTPKRVRSSKAEKRAAREAPAIPRVPWSYSEQLLLCAAAEAAALDFDVIYKAFSSCFHPTRTPRSLRAQFYRVKRADQAAPAALVMSARKVLDLWGRARADLDEGLKDPGHSSALAHFAAEAMVRSGRQRTSSLSVPDVLDDDGEEEAPPSPQEDGVKREESSESTVFVAEECKRRRRSGSLSPAPSTSPMTPTSCSVGRSSPCSPAGSPVDALPSALPLPRSAPPLAFPRFLFVPISRLIRYMHIT